MPSPMNKNTYLGAFADSTCCAAGCVSGAVASCFGVSAAACVCVWAGCAAGCSVVAGAAEQAAMLSASAALKIPLMIFFAFIGVSSLYYAL